MRGGKPVRISLLAERFDLAQLLLALLICGLFEGHGFPVRKTFDYNRPCVSASHTDFEWAISSQHN
jgi:hypothetical protein